jgi:hypothetical protein
MASRKEKFKNSIKNIQLDQDGFIVGVKGRCLAKDLWDDDFCKELGIRRIKSVEQHNL